MPNANYIVKQEETIFDATLKLYGDVSFAIKLMTENQAVIVDINEDIQGDTVIYDGSFKAQTVAPLIIIVPANKNLAQKYSPKQNQTIFDVALMLAGDLESIINVTINSTLNNINTELKISDVFNYNKKSSALLDWIEKTGQIFVTKTPINDIGGREHTSAFDLLSHT